MNAPTLAEVVLRCRKRLKEGRLRCQVQHDKSKNGFQISTLLADLYDDVVLDVWQTACDDHFDGELPKDIALVATGGFGRRDVAPFSDVDLMLLTKSATSKDAEIIAGALTRNLVDAGLQVGFAMRTPVEACRLSWDDPVIFSSLTITMFPPGWSVRSVR